MFQAIFLIRCMVISLLHSLLIRWVYLPSYAAISDLSPSSPGHSLLPARGLLFTFPLFTDVCGHCFIVVLYQHLAVTRRLAV